MGTSKLTENMQKGSRWSSRCGTNKAVCPYCNNELEIGLYNALIQSYFDYCYPLGDSCCTYLRDELQKFAGASNDISSTDVLESFGCETLEVRPNRIKQF